MYEMEDKMRIEPLVSVVVAVSENEETIYGCIESILEQTYRNLEIILVVDDSFDRINIICNNLVMMDSRIRLLNITPDKKGNADYKIKAFYEGLRYTDGSYVAFVDSNDRLHRDMIRTLINICIKYQCPIACCKTVLLGSGLQKDNNRLYYSKKATTRVYRRNAAFLSRKFTCEFYGKLFDMDLFEEISQSDLFLYPLYYRADRIAVVERYLYYRQEIISTDNFGLRADAVIKYYKDRIRYFKKRERELYDLSHEYYCEFLADYYLYQIKNLSDIDGPEKTLSEFRREFNIVRYNTVTPIYTKLRLELLYRIPKLYVTVIKILRIKRYKVIISNIKRL